MKNPLKSISSDLRKSAALMLRAADKMDSLMSSTATIPAVMAAVEKKTGRTQGVEAPRVTQEEKDKLLKRLQEYQSIYGHGFNKVISTKAGIPQNSFSSYVRGHLPITQRVYTKLIAVIDDYKYLEGGPASALSKAKITTISESRNSVLNFVRKAVEEGTSIMIVAQHIGCKPQKAIDMMDGRHPIDDTDMLGFTRCMQSLVDIESSQLRAFGAVAA